MPKGGLEPPRAITLTWPSTMRVYQIPPLRHKRELQGYFFSVSCFFFSVSDFFFSVS
jgi:hypothetical protein